MILKIKKKLLPAASVFILLLVTMTVIFTVFMGHNSLKNEFTLYFLNENGSTLVSEKRIFRYHNDGELIESILESLVKGSDKNKPVINKKTKLNGIERLEDNKIVVDFNYRFISGDTARDVLSAYAVVKTLCGIDGIDSVKVTVEKNDIPTSEGKPIGFLTDADINLSTDTNTSETKEVTLYFKSGQTGKLAKEARSIKVNDQLPLAQYVINELIRGSQESGNDSVLSGDTVLISVTISDNICFVNFDSSFLSKNSGSQEKEKLVVYSVVNSLTELNNIARVQFFIDGKKEEKFGSLDFDCLFERNTEIFE